MVTPMCALGGRRSWTGSRLVLGGLLALAVILGMLAMHNLRLETSTAGDSPSISQRSSASHISPTSPGSTADTPAKQGHTPPVLSCLLAVGLGLLLVLPRPWGTSNLLTRLRAVQVRQEGQPVLRRKPSINVLCINRC